MEKVTPNNSHFELSKKPDIINLFRLKQISGIQQDLVGKLESMLEAPITQEVLIPNAKHPQHEFRIDFVVGEVGDIQLAVEVDGKYYHDNPKSKERDQRKTEVMEDMDYHIVRIPYEIPRELVYGHLQGNAREAIKAKYAVWRERWLERKATYIKQEYEYLLRDPNTR